MYTFSKHISSVKVVCYTKLEKSELYSNEKMKKDQSTTIFAHVICAPAYFAHPNF